MTFFVFTFFAGFYLVISYYSHHIMVLLGLEILMLSLFYFFCTEIFMSVNFYLSFIFLLILVCLGGFGVSLLVTSSRNAGKDFCSPGY